MLLIDPTDEHTPIAVKLNFEVTKNAAEYEACIAGLEAALERNIKELEMYGDSAFIIKQVSNKWKTVDPGLQKYHAYMKDLVAQFKEVSFHYLPRDRNRFADALAILASLVKIPEGKSVRPFRVGRRENPAYNFEIEGKDEPVYDPLKLPESERQRARAPASGMFRCVGGVSPFVFAFVELPRRFYY